MKDSDFIFFTFENSIHVGHMISCYDRDSCQKDARVIGK